MEHRSQKTLICDLDNTLYDWVKYFVSSFYSMVDEAVNILGCDRELLLNELRDVHRKHKSSEHSFSLLETQIYKSWSRGRENEALKEIDMAFKAFNSQRKKSLQLYPGVSETLAQLTAERCRLIAYSESTIIAVVDRMRRLGIAKYFSQIYCRKRTIGDHDYEVDTRTWIGDFPIERVVLLPETIRKPDQLVAELLKKQLRLHVHETYMIGDSVAKDVLLAQRAGFQSIWAAYGAKHSEADYEKLVRISHWSESDILREKALVTQASSVHPDYTCYTSFAEVLDIVK
jgi:FMN phosphatase YigB (HAD superfamily)